MTGFAASILRCRSPGIRRCFADPTLKPYLLTLTWLIGFGGSGIPGDSVMQKRLRLGSKLQQNTGLPGPHSHHLCSRLRPGNRQRPAALLGDLGSTAIEPSISEAE